MTGDEYKPRDIDAEESVVGSLLIDGSAISKTGCDLRATDFYSERNMLIYASCQAIHMRNESINQITVAQDLARQNKLETCGGAAYLSHLISICPTSLDIGAYAKIVFFSSFYRKLYTGITSEVQILVKQLNPNISESISQMQNKINELATKYTMEGRQVSLNFGKCEIIKSRPPTFIWNINGKNIRLSAEEISHWPKLYDRIVAELYIIPIKPANFDEMVNDILTRSKRTEAPIDASDEYQLKLSVKAFIDRKPNATVYSEMADGYSIIRKYSFKGRPEEDYEWFLSTPLIRYLRDISKQVFKPAELWSYLYRWRGEREHKIQMNTDDGGKTTGTFWGLPVVFLDETVDLTQIQQPLPEEKPDNHDGIIPDGI